MLDRNIAGLPRTNLKYKKSLEFVDGPEALLIVEFSADDRAGRRRHAASEQKCGR